MVFQEHLPALLSGERSRSPFKVPFQPSIGLGPTPFRAGNVTGLSLSHSGVVAPLLKSVGSRAGTAPELPLRRAQLPLLPRRQSSPQKSHHEA